MGLSDCVSVQGSQEFRPRRRAPVCSISRARQGNMHQNLHGNSAVVCSSLNNGGNRRLAPVNGETVT